MEQLVLRVVVLDSTPSLSSPVVDEQKMWPVDHFFCCRQFFHTADADNRRPHRGEVVMSNVDMGEGVF